MPIREQEAFAGRLLCTPNGETVLDFGQNMAGYVEMKLTAHAGQKLRLLCGEALDENGNFTQENFQDRNRHKEGGTAQLLELICKEGENHYKPSFTIMGFRYAKVETDIDLTGAEFTAHAVYSEMPVTGSFACGNADVDQLMKNSVWSQKSNFCDIPTDCPTRERAGWTGDMGVFIETGLTLMDCYPVVEKWLAECRLNQYPDGRMANIAPPTSRPGYMTPMLCMSAGWGDAAILVPYALYKRTGDRKILADNYEMMQKWYALPAGACPADHRGAADRGIRQVHGAERLGLRRVVRAGHYPHAGHDEPAQERGYGVSGLFRAASGRNCAGAGQGRGRSAVPRHRRKGGQGIPRRLYG